MITIMEVSEFWLSMMVALTSTLVGIVLALWIYFRQLRDRRPSFAVWSRRLIELPSPSRGLSLAFGQGDISRATLSRVLFWNGGAGTIHGSDLVLVDPLRIETDAAVLSAELVAQSKEANQFSLKTDNQRQTVLLTFDYLDLNQFALIDVMHTSADSPTVKGEIQGALLGLQRIDPEARESQFMLVAGLLVGAITASSFVALSGMSQWWRIGFSLAIAILLTLIARALLPVRAGIPRSLRNHAGFESSGDQSVQEKTA